jgi:hypothetical protein
MDWVKGGEAASWKRMKAVVKGSPWRRRMGWFGQEPSFFWRSARYWRARWGGLAGSAIEEEGFEADGGGDRVAPAAVGLLRAEDGVNELLGEGVVGLVELVEADEGECGGRGGLGEFGLEAWGAFGPGDQQLAGEAVVLAGGPETLDLSYGLHGGILSSRIGAKGVNGAACVR